MTTRRMVVMAGGAVAPIALVSLLFNNQWVVEGIRRGGFDYSGGIGPLVGTFQFTGWRLTWNGSAGFRHWLALDVGFLLFLALLGALAFAAVRVTEPRQGVLGSIVSGWWAAAVAGGAAGLVRGALLAWAMNFPMGLPTSRTVWNSVHSGAGFGVMFGWIAGLGVLGALMLTRQREAVQQPYGAQQQYGQQQPYGQPYGGQQPYGASRGVQAPQQGTPQQGVPQQGVQPHPSAVPYVPPQGPPQQPQWGGVPQQPGAPQQFGAPPAPAQQPPVQQAQSAQQVQPAQQPQPAQGEAKPSEPGRPAAGDAAAPGEAAGNEAADEKAGAPGSAPEDDLNLADRTVVDRERDDG